MVAAAPVPVPHDARPEFRVPAGTRAAYVLGADPVDLAGLDPGDVDTVAHEHARFAAVRAPGQTLLRVRAADSLPTADSGRSVRRAAATVVEIVTDDMPFLVDSITAALARVHATTRVLLHPRPVVARDAAGVLVGIGDPAAPPALPRDGRSARESWIRVQTRPLEAAAANSWKSCCARCCPTCGPPTRTPPRCGSARSPWPRSWTPTPRSGWTRSRSPRPPNCSPGSPTTTGRSSATASTGTRRRVTTSRSRWRRS